MKLFKILFVILSLCFYVSNLHAADDELYIWTDEKGIKHFTNTPPPKNARNIKILLKDKLSPMPIYKPKQKKTSSPKQRPLDGMKNLEALIERATKQVQGTLEIEKKKPQYDLFQRTEKLITVLKFIEANYFLFWMTGVLIISLLWLFVRVMKRGRRYY